MVTTRSIKTFTAGLVEGAKEFHRRQSCAAEEGFTLLETTIAFLIMMIVALGSASLFSFSIYHNSGGSDRAVALAIGQQRLEMTRIAQFNTTTTDDLLTGGTRIQSDIIRSGRLFTMTITIDDDPSTLGDQVNPDTNLKGIKILVAPQSMGRGWAFGVGGTVTLMTQRARTDR